MPNPGNRNGQLRKEAMSRGDKHYVTGMPCKYGHIGSRYVSTGSCVQCDLERNLKFHKRNPAKRGEYHCAHKEKANAYSREYLRRNKEYFSEKAKERYYADVDKSRAYARERRRISFMRDPDKQRVKGQVRHSRVRKSKPPHANMELIEAIYALRPKGYHVDHAIPLKGVDQNGIHVICGLHHEGNLQYLPAHQNLTKHNRWSETGSKDSCAIVPFSWEHFLVISEQA